MSKNTPKHAESTWRQSLKVTNKMMAPGDIDDSMNDVIVIFRRHQLALTYSVNDLPKGYRTREGFQFYLYNCEDSDLVYEAIVSIFTNGSEDEKTGEIRDNFTIYTKTLNAEIFVRSVPNENVFGRKERRVFTDEVLRVFPVVLWKQRGGKEASGDEALKEKAELDKLRNDWSTPPEFRRTISISEFEKALETFDIDKGLITMVEDPVYVSSCLQFTRFVGDVFTYSPDTKVVFNRHQAVFKVFKESVLGVNWKTRDLEALEQSILDLMRHFLNLEEGLYITHGYINKLISSIKRTKYPNNFPYDEAYINNRDESLRMTHDSNQNVARHVYGKQAEGFNLTHFLNLPGKIENLFGNGTTIPVWNHRVFIMFGWIQQFFDRNEFAIVLILKKNLSLMTPAGGLRKIVKKFLNDQLRGNPLEEGSKYKPWKPRDKQRKEAMMKKEADKQSNGNKKKSTSKPPTHQKKKKK